MVYGRYIYTYLPWFTNQPITEGGTSLIAILGFHAPLADCDTRALLQLVLARLELQHVKPIAGKNEHPKVIRSSLFCSRITLRYCITMYYDVL